jgi:lycopene beta-cyclase
MLLDRCYAMFATDRLQHVLRARADASGCGIETGTVRRIEHDDLGSTLELTDGRDLRSSVVIDASGAASRFLTRSSDDAPAWQVAYGQLIDVPSHPWFEGEMVLMDWRPIESRATVAELPTFLYVLPLGKNLLFVEETSLCARPAAAISTLQSRLHRRLRGLGIETRDVLAEEHCRIPMGLPLPRRDQRTLGYGVAAGRVHPATGYQLARSLETAPAMARAIANALGTNGPIEASAAGWRAVWPREDILQWELYAFGTNFLCSLGAQDLRLFFRAFFSLPTAEWHGFLSGTLGVPRLARAMGRVFASLEGRLQWRLVNGSAPVLAPVLRAAVSL